MFENVSLAFQGIWGHKLRSFLTILGIIIGIAAIITIVSTIKGTNEQIKENLIGAGNNTVNVMLYQGDSTLDFDWQTPPEGVYPVSDAAMKQIGLIDSVERASLYVSRSYSDGKVFHGGQNYSGAVYGIDENYFFVKGYRLLVGRNFTAAEYAGQGKPVLLDEAAVDRLFNNEDPVGKTIEISQEPFTVIGVVEQSSDFKPVIESLGDYYNYMNQGSGELFVPYACWPLIYAYDEPQKLVLRTSSTDAMTDAGRQAADILTAGLSVASDQQISYKSEDLLEQAKHLQELSNATNQQLLWIAGISLLVGGIGVMNIMLVSVTERTREIGLKKAIGATRTRILRQFLTEAAVLTSLGGILGVLVGIGLAQLVSRMAGTPVAIDVPAAIIAVVFSMLIGVVFGLLPAVKASNLNPIEALRRE